MRGWCGRGGSSSVVWSILGLVLEWRRHGECAVVDE